MSVLDKKVGAYSAPFLCKTKGEAIRSFTDAVKDSTLPFQKHPEDYCLHFIGEFDDTTAQCVPNSFPEPLLEAMQVES